MANSFLQEYVFSLVPKVDSAALKKAEATMGSSVKALAAKYNAELKRTEPIKKAYEDRVKRLQELVDRQKHGPLSKKQEEEYKKQGIEKRWAEMECGFYICKTNNDDTFYLNKNGCFYNTTTNVREHNFDTQDELNKYLEDNADDIKAKYGEVEFKKYRRRIMFSTLVGSVRRRASTH